MSGDRNPQTEDKYIVRFPEGMRDRLKAEAKANNRTLNAEIVARLERSFAVVDMGMKGDPLDHLGQMSLMLSMLLNDRIQGKTREEIAALARSATKTINGQLALADGPHMVVLDREKIKSAHAAPREQGEANQPDRPVPTRRRASKNPPTND